MKDYFRGGFLLIWGTVIVVGVVGGALFGVDASLKLHQHRGNGLEGIDFGRFPRAQFEVDETKHAPGRIAEKQRHRGAHDDIRLRTPPLLRSVQVLFRRVAETGEVRLAEILRGHKYGV